MHLAKINGRWRIISRSGYSISPFEVGFVMAYGGATDPESGNWLICDGRDTTGTNIELETYYPKLYKFLGNTNILPDWRECTVKMPGSNTQGAAHNPIALNAFQDDRGQSHTHTMAHTHTRGTMNITGGPIGACIWGASWPAEAGAFTKMTPGRSGAGGNQEEAGWNFDASRTWTGETSQPSNANTGAASSRTGTTTEVKAVGLNWIICAR